MNGIAYHYRLSVRVRPGNGVHHNAARSMPKGFFEMHLVIDSIIGVDENCPASKFEGEPTGYPGAPVSKRRVYVDARNMAVSQAITYDRQGLPWKGCEAATGQRKSGAHEILTSDGRADDAPQYVCAGNHVTNVCQLKMITNPVSSG